MELFPDLTDLPHWESKPLLELRPSVMLPNRVAIALMIELDPHSPQIPILEYPILDTLLSVEAANALQCHPLVLPDAHHAILSQHEAKPSPAVEALLVAEEAVIAAVDDHRLVAGQLVLWHGVGLLDQGQQELL